MTKKLKNPSKLLVIILPFVPLYDWEESNVFLDFMHGKWGQGGGVHYFPGEVQIQAYYCVTGDGSLHDWMEYCTGFQKHMLK
jgi:hypothetical protein